jgi:hypothetical protein
MLPTAGSVPMATFQALKDVGFKANKHNGRKIKREKKKRAVLII